MSTAPLLTVAIALPLLMAALVVPLARRFQPALGALSCATLAASGLLVAIVMGRSTPAAPWVETWTWMPLLGMNFSFIGDGLSLFYGLIICGVGALVCWYAKSYLKDEPENQGRFFASLLLFAAAMLATVCSENLLLLVVAWEVTGAASFLLIGFYHQEPAAQEGARRALLVTATTGLCLLTGLIMLGLDTGTYSFLEITAAGGFSGERGETWKTASLILVLIGVFGKSAQFPFHFWLPGAMVAPTPVSVYLHSATMVKLGVFLVARLFPFYADHALWFPLLGGVCFGTMLLGAWLALRSNDLKAILAYTTVSQLGMLLGYYAVGGVVGVRYDYLLILTHVFYKAALFMIAGIVDQATGTRDIRELGGLRRDMPVIAVATVVCAGALGSLPLTAGFLGKEALVAELFTAYPLHPEVVMAMLGALLLTAIFSVAIAARLFLNVFIGPRPQGLEVRRPDWKISLPVVALASAALVLGLFPALFQHGFDLLRVPGLHADEGVHLALWHGFSPELAFSAVALAAGVLLYLREQYQNWSRTRVPAFLRFDEFFERGLESLTRGAGRLTLALRADWPPAYLPITIAFLLTAMGALIATSNWEEVRGTLPAASVEPLRLGLVLFVTAGAAGVLFLRRWTAQLVAVSVSGFFITLYFVVSRAPDLALTQILVESASVVMILFLLSRFPSSSQIGVRFEWVWDFKHILRAGLSLGVGLLMSLIVLFVEQHRHPDPVGPRYLELTQPAAEGANAVNTILVDFRGFDTLGEITVVLIAALGSLGMMMRYRRQRDEPFAVPGFLLGKHPKDER